MRSRKRLVYLVACLLLLQVICIPAQANGEAEVAITYDSAARTVSVKASGFSANAMLSLTGYYDEGLDYLNQYTAGETGELEVTYKSSATWAEGGVIKVVIGAAELPEPIVRTVTVTGGAKPYIKYYTSSLTRKCAANILVEIGNPAAGLSAEVVVNGGTYKALFNAGESAMIKVTEVINETELTLRLMNGEEELEVKTIEMKDMPESLWKPNAERSGSDLRVVFAARVSPAPKGYAATINEVAVTAIPDGDNILKFEDAELLEENALVISGVMFPEYFPSYSFTFRVSI